MLDLLSLSYNNRPSWIGCAPSPPLPSSSVTNANPARAIDSGLLFAPAVDHCPAEIQPHPAGGAPTAPPPPPPAAPSPPRPTFLCSHRTWSGPLPPATQNLKGRHLDHHPGRAATSRATAPPTSHPDPGGLSTPPLPLPQRRWQSALCYRSTSTRARDPEYWWIHHGRRKIHATLPTMPLRRLAGSSPTCTPPLPTARTHLCA
jgi:hypothetical protein